MGNFYDKFKKNICGAFIGTSLFLAPFCVKAQQITWKAYIDSASNKNPASAIPYLEKALKVAGSNLEKKERKMLLKKLANMYASSNNLDKAIFYSTELFNLLEKSLSEKHNDNIDIKSELIKVLLQTADWQRFNMDLLEASQTYRSIIKNYQQGNENAIVGLIFVHYLLGEYTIAQKYINNLSGINPNNPITVAFNAYSQISVNDTLIKVVEKNNSGNLYVLLIVAAAYAKKNDVKTAIQKYDAVIKSINEEQGEETQGNFKNFNKYLKNFVFLEKANIYMGQKDFLRAEIEFSNLIKNGVKTFYVNFARIIAQKEHVIAHQKMYTFSADEIQKLTQVHNLKSTNIPRQFTRIVTYALKNCSGSYDQNDPSNIWTFLLNISTDIANQHTDIAEHQINLIKLFIRTGQTTKAKTKLEECFAKIKTDNLKPKHYKEKLSEWNIEMFEQLKKENDIIQNDNEAPKVYVLSPKFSENLARGGGEKELSEEKFEILFNVSDNVCVDKIIVNGQQQNFVKAKEVLFNFQAKFTIEIGLKQTFVIDVYDKSGNYYTEKIDIRRKPKEDAKKVASKASEKLQNKSLDAKLIGKQYLVLVGTDQYNNWTPLNNAVLDMTTLHKTLKEKYKVDSVVTMYNKTKEEVINSFYALANVHFGDYDQILIAVAGHGDFLFNDNRKQGRGFIVPKDARPKDLDKGRSSYISYDDFKAIINQIPCKKIMLLIDVCFAGTIDERIATRGVPEIKLSDNEKANEFLKENNQKECSVTITSGGKESVYDGKPGENSPFMKEVIKALEREGNIFGLLTGDEFWNNIADEHLKGSSHLKTTPHLSNIKEINTKLLGTFLFFKK